MSINGMTNAALARRPDFEPANRVPQGLAEIAQAAGAAPAPVPAAAAPPAPAPVAPPPASNVNAALQVLTTYIPTEVLTLYVATVAALGKLTGRVGHWLPFWIFLAVTPLIVWLAFATKVKAAGRAIPASPGTWPMWEMFAATIAYVAWAFALPNTPFLDFKDMWYSASVAGLAVLVVSYGLSAVAPLMQRALSQ